MISNLIDLKIEKSEVQLETDVIKSRFSENINLYQKLLLKFKQQKKIVTLSNHSSIRSTSSRTA